MQLTQRRIEIRRPQRVLLAVASGVVALATCATALALRMDVAQPVAAASSGGGSVQVSPAVMAGQVVYKKPPVYPAEAKANHDTVDGPVVLHVVVGKDGAVEEIQVAQSLRRDYDLSALDAVREWRWKPYLLNGEPVEVDTDVTVTYSMGH